VWHLIDWIATARKAWHLRSGGNEQWVVMSGRQRGSQQQLGGGQGQDLIIAVDWRTRGLSGRSGLSWIFPCEKISTAGYISFVEKLLL